MQRVSVICVYNNKEQLDNQLLLSLAEQRDVCVDVVLVDNRNNIFSSASKALNYGASRAKSEILLFCHQDIFFKTDNELCEIADCIAAKPVGAIVGIAAAVEGNPKNLGNFTSGKRYVKQQVKRIAGEIVVSCVDELFIGMKRETYEQHHFDEILCDNWHLYAVEMCLFHRRNNDNVYLFPVEFHHFSGGRINLNYMKGLLKLADEYRKDFKYIWTTCYKVRTSFLYTRILYYSWVLNRKIRRKEL